VNDCEEFLRQASYVVLHSSVKRVLELVIVKKIPSISNGANSKKVEN
jgi:hypothetical protein